MNFGFSADLPFSWKFVGETFLFSAGKLFGGNPMVSSENCPYPRELCICWGRS